MNCPKCSEEMEMTVRVEIRLPSKYANLISKEVIKKKECKLVCADWPNAVANCYACGIREKGL
jgi:hypothetical protein